MMYNAVVPDVYMFPEMCFVLVVCNFYGTGVVDVHKYGWGGGIGLCVVH